MTARDAVQVSPDGRELLALLSELPRPGLLGIAGAPGSGKTTLAGALGHTVVPLDGFHLANVELERRGLRDRKGAPETFDAWGYADLLTRLRARPDHVVMAPGFERGLEQPLAGAIAILPGDDVLVTEGNYLLLEQPEWRAVRRQLDVVWQVVVDDEVRRQRLVDRHVQFGKSPASAREWVARVDEPNAVLIEAARERADVLLDLNRWSGEALRRTPPA